MKRLFLLVTVCLALVLSATAAPGLKVQGGGVAPTGGELFANAENRITTLVQSLTLTNTGDVDLNPGDEGYSLTLYSYSVNVDCQTYTPDFTLAVGEVKNIEVNWDFDFAPLDAAYIAGNEYGSNGASWDNFRVRENITGTNSGYMGPWMDVIPYRASFNLVEQNSNTEVDRVINFGFVDAAKTLKFRIRATGAADVNVTDISVPEGFTVSPATPFTVPGKLTSTDNYMPIELTFDPAIISGVVSGDLIITAEGVDPKSYPVQGVAMAADELFEDFESEEPLQGWIVENYWERRWLDYQLTSDVNHYAYYHSRSSEEDASMLITPRLKFDAGGKMLYALSKVSAYSSDSRMRVFWSPDRSNWTLLQTVDINGENGAKKLPNYGNWGSYVIDNIPEGEGYIAFEGKYIWLNDIYGGKVVDVDYDVFVDSFEVTAKCFVNDRIDATLTISNLLADKSLAADAYTVQLMVDGKVVDTAVPVEIAGGTQAAFTMGYTPHAVGDVELTAVLKVGETTLTSTAITNVIAESSSNVFVVGNSDSTTSNLPLKTNYNNSESQCIYTEDYLAQFGIVPGMRIDGIKYDGYCTTDKDVTGTFTVAFKKVEVDQVNNTEPWTIEEEDILKVQEQKYDFHNSGYTNYYTFLDFTFDTPYVYTGGNLLIIVRSEAQNYANVTFKKDGSKSNVALYKYNDNHDNFLTASWNVEYGLPVTQFVVYKDPAKAIGKVTDSTGAGLADIVVNYSAGDVLYSTTTDQDGNYSMEIFRPELEYTVWVDNENYPYTIVDGTVKFENGSLIAEKNFTLPDFATERIYNVTFNVTNNADQNLEGSVFSLRSNLFSLAYSDAETILDANGSVTIKCFGGSHTIGISVPGLKAFNETFSINKDMVFNFNLEEDTNTPYGLKAQLSHDAQSGVNNIALSWNNEEAAFFDDFEGHKAFSIDFQPWTGIDGDQAAPAVLSGNYDHSGELNYGQIINPYAVEPMWDLNNYWTLAARSGRQYLGFVVRNDGKPLDDMAITPAVSIGENYTLRFYAKGSDKVNARFTVGITEVLDNPQASDFVTISEGNYIECGFEKWTPIQISLADYAGKDVKVAIHCISDKGSFVSMIDDIFIGRLSPVAAAQRPKRSAGNPNESFVISLDGEDVATTTDYNYLLENVAYGEHTLGVKAKYVNTESRVATIDVNIAETDFVKTTITLKPNNSVNPQGMTVNVEAVNAIIPDAVYSIEADEAGVATLNSLPKGLYRITIAPKDFNPWQDLVDIQEEMNINAFLFESIYKPFNLTIDTEEQPDGSFNAIAKWNQDLGFADGFESYNDFATGSFGNWITKDLNEPTAYSYPISFGGSIVTFPGCSTQQSPASVPPMVFNPAATTPSMAEDMAVAAPEGQKLVIFQGPQAAAADKWLISPVIEVRDDYELSLLAKSYPVYPETLEFCVNEEGTDDVADFKVIDTVSPSYEEWTQYSMNVGEYAGKSVRFAIHCTSLDGFIALVDDFKVGRTGGETVTAVGKVLEYVVKLDNDIAGTTTEATYALTGIEAGSHTLGVRARYESGYSELAELPFNLISGVNGITNGNAVSVRGITGAILVDAPADAQVTVISASGITMASKISNGNRMRIEVDGGVYAVKVAGTIHKVIVR